MSKPLYRRILLKLSGEALASPQGYGVDPAACFNLAMSLKKMQEVQLQIAVVIGGGNIFRGQQGVEIGMERPVADHIGMLATIINAISLQQGLEQVGSSALVMSALGATEIVERFEWRRALRLLNEGQILIFAGGTGHPFFTTDTNAAMRAAEIKADVLLKGTKVDGVYNADPFLDKNAIRFDHLTYQEALEKQLKVMDATAISMCQENAIPIKVVSLSSLWEGIVDPKVGTLVSKGMV